MRKSADGPLCRATVTVAVALIDIISRWNNMPFLPAAFYPWKRCNTDWCAAFEKPPGALSPVSKLCCVAYQSQRRKNPEWAKHPFGGGGHVFDSRSQHC